MEVEIIRTTFDAVLGYLQPGDILPVSQAVADRWIARKIAKKATAPAQQKEPAAAPVVYPETVSDPLPEPETDAGEADEPEPIPEPIIASEPEGIVALTKAELFDKAKQAGLAVNTTMRKADLIDLLEGSGIA